MWKQLNLHLMPSADALALAILVLFPHKQRVLVKWVAHCPPRSGAAEPDRWRDPTSRPGARPRWGLGRARQQAAQEQVSFRGTDIGKSIPEWKLHAQ